MGSVLVALHTAAGLPPQMAPDSAHVEVMA